MTSRSNVRPKRQLRPCIRWTRELAIARLQALADRIERDEGRRRTPRREDVARSDVGCPWDRQITQLFGGLGEYQIAAGFKPTKRGRPKRRRCVSGRHRLTPENTIVERRPWKDGTGYTEVRRCLACMTERLARYPSTTAGREARRLANRARCQSQDARKRAFAEQVRGRWGSGRPHLTVLRVIDDATRVLA